VPRDLFAQSAANQRSEKCARTDPDIINLKSICGARVARAIERAHLAREIALQAADTDHEEQQREQKRNVERHQEMARRHQ
jgi:hypothetical protein